MEALLVLTGPPYWQALQIHTVERDGENAERGVCASQANRNWTPANVQMSSSHYNRVVTDNHSCPRLLHNLKDKLSGKLDQIQLHSLPLHTVLAEAQTIEN